MIKKDGNKMSAAIKMLKGNFEAYTDTIHVSHRAKLIPVQHVL